MKKAGAIALMLAAVVLMSGCGEKFSEPYKDAPRGTTNGSKADLVTFPDGFNNVSSKCDGTNRVYVTYHGDAPYGSLAVVPNDPRCK